MPVLNIKKNIKAFACNAKKLCICLFFFFSTVILDGLTKFFYVCFIDCYPGRVRHDPPPPPQKKI